MSVALVRQQVFADGVSGTSRTQTLTTAPVAGDALVLMTTTYGGPVTSVTGGRVTWREVPTAAGAFGGFHDTGPDGAYDQIWYGLAAAASGSLGIVIATTASDFVSGNIAEYSGFPDSVTAVLVANDSGNGTGSGAASGSPSPGTLTASALAVLAVVGMSDFSGNVPTYPSGYTALTAPVSGWWGAYDNTPVTGAPTFTISSDPWASVGTVFTALPAIAGVLSLSGSGTVVNSIGATGALALSGTLSATTAKPTGIAGTLSLIGTVPSTKSAGVAAGVLSLTGTAGAGASARPVAAGAVTLTGAATEAGQQTSAGALSLVGAGNTTKPFAAGGVLALTNIPGFIQAGVTTTGAAVSLSGALGSTVANPIIAGAISFTGAQTPPTGFPVAAGLLGLSGADVGSVRVVGAGGITLVGAGAGRGSLTAAQAQALLALVGSAGPGIRLPAAAGAVSLSGAVVPLAICPTSTAILHLAGTASLSVPFKTVHGVLALASIGHASKLTSAAAGALLLVGHATTPIKITVAGAIALSGAATPYAKLAAGVLTLSGATVGANTIKAQGAITLSSAATYRYGYKSIGRVTFAALASPQHQNRFVGAFVLGGALGLPRQVSTRAVGSLSLSGSAATSSHYTVGGVLTLHGWALFVVYHPPLF